MKSKVVINEAAAFAKVDGEAVVLDVEKGVYFGLNEVGTRIWESLLQGNSEEEILEQLVAEYEVEAELLHRDISEFVNLLITNNLAQRSVGYQ